MFAESHVGVFMQNFVRRQWRCMFFFECKCTLLRFFLMACALRKGNCIFKSLKILWVRNIRNLTYFHLFRKKIKDVSHTSFSPVSDCYCPWRIDNHCIVTEKPKCRGEKKCSCFWNPCHILFLIGSTNCLRL